MGGWGVVEHRECVDMFFSRSLPETKLSSSKCTLLFPRSGQKCAKVLCSHWKKKTKTAQCYLKEFKKHPTVCLTQLFHCVPLTSPFIEWTAFLYTSAFWLFSSTFSSSFFSSSEEPFSFSAVFQLPCLSDKKTNMMRNTHILHISEKN